jgi:DNA polymerase III subunit gamma/tau
MAYEVTATRRRPQRFEDMIGQDFVVATLQKSVVAGKIAHAYLFSGPRGCGKTSSARILAKALNCEKGPGATPCGQCSACAEITRGASLDVIEIDGASNTSVNDVRQIKDEVLFPPNSCRYKVYIIDEVHMLSTSAFNALLKTIEEPPPYVIFIFATTELHKVPATIKSRCQQFNFRLVPVELLKDSLAAAALESGIKADDEALFWIAREATGSVRDAYTLFDQVAAFSDGHVTFDKIRDKLGLVGVDRINPLAEACAERDAQGAFLALDGLIENGVSVDQFTVDLADYYRNLLLIKSGVTKESLLGQRPDRFSAKVLDLWSATQLERALGLTLQLYRDIRYSLDPRYELELAVSRLSWLSDYVSPVELKAAVVKAQTLLMQGAGGAPASGGSATRRGDGPFDGADTDPERVTPDVRENGLSATPDRIAQIGDVNGDLSASAASGSDGPAESPDRIADPFAAFKARISGGAVSGGAPAAYAPAPTQPVAETDALARDTIEPEQSTPAQPAAAPMRQSPAASDARNALPFENLRESLVARFQATNNMVATTLAQSFDWKRDGSTVSFSVDKPFAHNFLAQDHKLLVDAVSSLLGERCGLDIKLDASRLDAAKEESADEGVPAQVEMIRSMFRGTIAGEG